MGSGALSSLGASLEIPGKAGEQGVRSFGVNLGTLPPEKAMLQQLHPAAGPSLAGACGAQPGHPKSRAAGPGSWKGRGLFCEGTLGWSWGGVGSGGRLRVMDEPGRGRERGWEPTPPTPQGSPQP